jgi:hypothetical protein
MEKKFVVSTVSVLWLAMSQLSFAELKMIDDHELSNVTGKKGLTIDIEMGIEVGEFMYKDAGSIVMQGVRLGGMDRTGEVGTKFDGAVGIVYDPDDSTAQGYGGNTALNNVRVRVDVAGDGSDLTNNGTYYSSPQFFPNQPQTHLYAADNQFFWAWGQNLAGTGNGATGCGNDGFCALGLGNGDLFIHAMPGTADANDNGTPHTIADFGYEMDLFALKDSTYQAGDDINNIGGTANTAQSTTIMSNFKMEGYFGGFDMLLENHGNAFGSYDQNGNFTENVLDYGDAASKIKVNSFVNITEMEYDFDIAGIRYEKISIHNHRARKDMFEFLTQDDYVDLGQGIGDSQGYAQANTQIYAVKDDVLHIGQGTDRAHYTDGIAMDNRFMGDMDIGHLSFGDTGQSVGSFYYTDIDVTTHHVISAHQ